MALLFLDSYDHYDTPLQKWDVNPLATIDLSGTQSRTGIGCIICIGDTSPELNVGFQVGAVVGTAYKSQAFVNDIFGLISGTGVFRVRQVRLRANSDGSVSVLAGNDPFPAVLGTSAPALMTLNNYAYIEMKVTKFAADGNVIVRINGAEVLNVIGNTNADSSGTYNTFYLAGAGGGNVSFQDDTYLLNLVDSGIPGNPNNDFLGAIRNYAQVPIGDASPLQWEPNTGTTHYTQVNTVPPPGDSSYVFDGTPGDADQYVYGTTGITPPVTVFGVQVCLNAVLDAAGSRSIAADVSGTTGASGAVTNTYHMVKNQFDGNPVSGQAWQLTDFGSVRFGPKVTA